MAERMSQVKWGFPLAEQVLQTQNSLEKVAVLISGVVTSRDAGPWLHTPGTPDPSAADTADRVASNCIRLTARSASAQEASSDLFQTQRRLR